MKLYKKIVTLAFVGVAMLLNVQIPTLASTQTILGSDVTQYIASRSNTVSIGVYDGYTGKTYTYNPSKTYQTASIVKISLLADVLYQRIPLTNNENSLLTRMIENSDNHAASTIWGQLGSDKNVQSFFRNAGMTNTIAGTSGLWGFTTTTVLDQLTMMKYFAYHNAFLNDAQRAYGLNLMRNVELDQRWGTGYGLPSGVSIALKNGWSNTNQPYNWRINSVGYINGQGKNYVISVLTINNRTESYGLDTINTISKLVWNEMPQHVHVIISNTNFRQAKSLVNEFEKRGFTCRGVNLKTYGKNEVPKDNDPYQFVIDTTLDSATQLVIELKTRGYDKTYGEAI
ncbi:class A beta-lactamase-related serine hydrolase [Neobacillus pocheonensis]|uniref:Class A beta-lactamase-related serine hydrolase n=1 Tax=Neobacillus pocheonensis TaxID=363869 RepID=A0ABT0WIU2_9BACI|nr:class A beta-lactamase-related serine hydrolase [Neobacillus pocheonensis]